MELKYATILVVDDESMLLDIFREWLEEEDCRILTAGNGAAALQILRDHHVDVIVSDVRMPVMDGVALVKKLTISSPTEGKDQAKMIFISGFTDLDPREAYNLGVEAVLQKPIERRQFIGAIQRSLQSREEKWSEGATQGGLPLHLALPRLSETIEWGRIAFGRGGFCLRCSSPIREGPVRFVLEFEAEDVSFAGHGLIRWAEPEESMLGVEILDLDKSCRDWAIHLIATHAGLSYIPRQTLCAAPKSKTAK